MARKTKAEREAQWEAEALERNTKWFKTLKSDWTRRVAVAMAKLAANESDVSVSVVDLGEGCASVAVTDPDRWSRRTWEFPVEVADLEFSEEALSALRRFNRALEELESLLALRKRERKEEARKDAVRKEALSKLSDEEKELLGL